MGRDVIDLPLQSTAATTLLASMHARCCGGVCARARRPARLLLLLQTFLYVICSLGIRSHVQRLLGTTPPKSAGGSIFAMPPQSGTKGW